MLIVEIITIASDEQGLTREVQKTSSKVVKLLSKNEPLVYEYFPKEGGQYTFEFITADAQSMTNQLLKQ